MVFPVFLAGLVEPLSLSHFQRAGQNVSGKFDEEVERESFDSDLEYLEYRMQEGMVGHDYDYSDTAIIDWAVTLVDTYQFDALQDWMEWSDQEMADFWDWWRDYYE